jgi:uncharacterized OB-fold protein
MSVLPPGLPAPIPEPDGLSEPYWSGLTKNLLRIQNCASCGKFQWGPEWICHHCHSFSLGWSEIPPRGRIYSWERVWHAVHPALRNTVPYVVVLVEHELGIRLLGNLIGPPEQDAVIGDPVHGLFEHHHDHQHPFSLLHWQRT